MTLGLKSVSSLPYSTSCHHIPSEPEPTPSNRLLDLKHLLPNVAAGRAKWYDVEYGSEEWLALRKADITSTDAAVLYDKSPYKDMFTLWHQKHGSLCDAVEDNDAMFWGRFMEAGIAYGIAAKEGFRITKSNGYFRLPDAKIGATPDYYIEGWIEDGRESIIPDTVISDAGILECKNVSYQAWQEDWSHKQEDGSIIISPPVHYEIQLLEQCVVTGLDWGVIGCVVGGNKHHVFFRQFTQEMKDQFLEKVRAFWEMDKPDVVTGKSVDALKQLYTSKGDDVKDASGDVDALSAVASYFHASEKEKTAKEEKDEAVAKIRLKMGNYPKMKGPGFSISRSVTERKGYTVEPTTVDQIRVTKKKD